MAKRKLEEDPQVSYLTLRRVVGLLGVFLPIALMLFGFAELDKVSVEPSISDYYKLRTRDVFVGALFTIGWFLYTYRGYDSEDDIVGNIACVFALGVALFPNEGVRWQEHAHYASAALLFLTLAYFSIRLFRMTDPKETPTPRKLLRNKLYLIFGIVMLVCIGLIGIYHKLLEGHYQRLDDFKPVFWLESLALWAFGFSWFIKGETLLKDPTPA